jgi:hypothetical protein
MELIKSLPKDVCSLVRSFCSHPTADALREHIADHQEYLITLPEPQTYPEANTFYMYYFTNKKLLHIMTAIRQIQALTGAEVRISEMALRPKLWHLYEKAFPNYFEDNRFNSDHIDYDANDFVDSDMEEALETN